MLADRRRLVVALLATSAVLAPLGWFWQASLVPDTYSVLDMGRLDAGGGPAAADRGRSVDTLVADPGRPADVRVALTARRQRFRLGTGQEVDGYTLNGRSPGPLIRARQGQLVEVELVNEDVAAGVTLHWHGVDVPNAMDGVAGVTQDAVGTGGSFTYRFVAQDAGTYWYHSHQVSQEQVRGGLLGGLVIDPATPAGDGQDELALLHVYDGTATVNGSAGDVRVDAPDGRRLRVRVVNTDNGSVTVWSSGAYRVLAVDGTDVNEPGRVEGRSLRLTAGGRADLEVVAPARLDLGGAVALVVGDGAVAAPQPDAELDLLSYGRPQPLGFDPDDADRRFDYRIGRRPGFLDGRPGAWWSVNGGVFPDVPRYVVAEGDVVRVRLENRSGVAHPMHLHGHHAVVLSRNGVRATGSPWVVDSLDVADGDSYELAFVADNPGVWTYHCHNLPHAADGLVAHLVYDGVRTPYEIGGAAQNEPE